MCLDKVYIGCPPGDQVGLWGVQVREQELSWRDGGSDPALRDCLRVNGGNPQPHRAHQQGAPRQTHNQVALKLLAVATFSSRQTFPYDPGLPEGTGSSRRVEEGRRREGGKRRGGGGERGGRRQGSSEKEQHWEEGRGEQESWNWTSSGWLVATWNILESELPSEAQASAEQQNLGSLKVGRLPASYHLPHINLVGERKG